MAGVGVTALDPYAVRLLDEQTIAAFLSFLNNQLIGRFSASAKKWRVASDEEIDAFSIRDGIPDGMPAAVPDSAIVRSGSLRSFRTSIPICTPVIVRLRLAPESRYGACGTPSISQVVRRFFYLTDQPRICSFWSYLDDSNESRQRKAQIKQYLVAASPADE